MLKEKYIVHPKNVYQGRINVKEAKETPLLETLSVSCGVCVS